MGRNQWNLHFFLGFHNKKRITVGRSFSRALGTWFESFSGKGIWCQDKRAPLEIFFGYVNQKVSAPIVFFPTQSFVTFKSRESVANIVWISLSLHLDYQSRPSDRALLRNAVGSEAVINDLHHQSPTQPHNKTKRSYGRLLPAIKLVTVFFNRQNTKWCVFVFASTYRYTEITTFTVKKKRVMIPPCFKGRGIYCFNEKIEMFRSNCQNKRLHLTKINKS